jgi:hypothetical protein
VAADAAGLAAEHQVSRDRIFALVVQYKEYFLGQVGGLPDVRGFLKAAADPLRLVLERRWTELLKESPPPLMVNILINPMLFFCHRDAVGGQYSKYFRPLYLDPNAIHLSRCGEECNHVDDASAKAVVELHREFDKHYHGDIASRPFLSLNDIEAILKGTAPLPPAGKVISMWRLSNEGSETRIAILSDKEPYQKDINEILRANQKAFQDKGVNDAIDKFDAYLERITRHGSYHHVTIGSEANWVGRVYLAFRKNEDPTRTDEWISRVKDFAFDLVGPMALAGTFLRNPDILEMLGDVRALLERASDTRRRHGFIFRQFSETSAQSNRKLFPTIKHVSDDLPTISRLETPRLNQLRKHIHDSSCQKCISSGNSFLHAVERCAALGQTLVADIASILGTIPEFYEVGAETVNYTANALAFGLTGDEKRPEHLAGYFFSHAISEAWVENCRTMVNEDSVPPLILPFFRVLLLMAGNRTMVETNANRFGVHLVGEPRLILPKPLDGQIIAQVEYRITGTLHQQPGVYILSVESAKLHQDKNGLLAYLGKQFLDDFQMYVCTATLGGRRVAQYRWFEEISAPIDTITYVFRCSISGGE